jgi:hypothetical protein
MGKGGSVCHNDRREGSDNATEPPNPGKLLHIGGAFLILKAITILGPFT